MERKAEHQKATQTQRRKTTKKQPKNNQKITKRTTKK